MSGRIPCFCGRKRGDHSDLVCTMYRCNYSAFNGGTPDAQRLLPGALYT